MTEQPILHELTQDLTELGARLRDITVVVSRGRVALRAMRDAGGRGSGIVWTPDTIITNAHVATEDALVVTFADGERAPAKVFARDKRRDLAVLRIEMPSGARTLRATAQVGEPSALRAGEVVVANGHPLGVEHSLSLGVVHTAPRGASNPYISADIRLAPGNSGGPLADARGRVVGVNSMIVAGLGVAVSTDAVKRMLLATAPKPSLGVRLRAVRVRMPVGAREDSVGLLVLGCEPHGAASNAGIIPGDVLLGHAGRPFGTPQELAQLLRAAGSLSELRLDVGRANKHLSVTVQLGQARRSRQGSGRRAA